MATATITSKGQITIPASVRERLGLSAGDRLEFVEIGKQEFVIKPASYDIRSLKGLIKRPAKPVTIEQMRETIRRRGAGLK